VGERLLTNIESVPEFELVEGLKEGGGGDVERRKRILLLFGRGIGTNGAIENRGIWFKVQV